MLNLYTIANSDVAVARMNELLAYLNEHDDVSPSGFTAKDVHMSGSSLSLLQRCGILHCTGRKESFYCIDEKENLYKKSFAKIYALRANDDDILAARMAKRNQKVLELKRKIDSLEEKLGKTREEYYNLLNL